MTNASAEITFLIHNLKTLQREIAIEGNEQLATIAKVFAYDIPLYIEKLRRLEELEHGKVNPRTSEETDTATVHIQEPRHSAMFVRCIPD